MACQIHKYGYGPTINYKGILIKHVISNKIRQIYQPMEQDRKLKINPSICSQLILIKSVRTQAKRQSSLKRNGVGKLD